MTPAIDALFAEISRGHRPESTLRWLARGAVHDVLVRLARLPADLDHAMLDSIPASRTREFVRALLVQAGTLPSRVEHLERLESWLAHIMTELPVSHATLIGPYAQWSVLRKARRRAGRRA